MDFSTIFHIDFLCLFQYFLYIFNKNIIQIYDYQILLNNNFYFIFFLNKLKNMDYEAPPQIKNDIPLEKSNEFKIKIKN